MHIHKAVRKAIKKDKYIAIKEFREFKIRPTDGAGNCIIMNADGNSPSKHGWQPSAKDLVRDDWIIVD